MKKIISGIQIGNVTIYADRLPDRKRPSLIVKKTGGDSIYGTFVNKEAAYEFFRILSEAPGLIGDE